MRYFAYGSNMSFLRLRARAPSVQLLGTAQLFGYQLRFHKAGSDGSGKCDAYCTDIADDMMYGVLYELDESSKIVLDRIEGLGYGYDDTQVDVQFGGQQVQAITYIATRIDKTRKPYDWYHHHVLVGAREAALPAHYLRHLESVAVETDPDSERHALEMSIYS